MRTSLLPSVLVTLLCAVTGVTARTRTFNFDITWEDNAPDGFTKKQMLVNGKSPGPLVEVEQDDDVVVKLNNKSPYNTTLHFHGMFPLYSPGLYSRLLA